MTKKLISFAILLMPMIVMADEVPSLNIAKADGSTISVAIADVSSIKFSDGAMVVNKSDDSQLSINVDDISLITFDSISTAISSLVNNAKDSLIVISDLTGKIIFRGKTSSDNIPQTLHGIYVITINGQSHKVAIK